MMRAAPWLLSGSIFVLGGLRLFDPAAAHAGVTREEVEHAIHDGVHFLKQQQHADGSWMDAVPDAHTSTTSLVVLTLLSAGEPVNAPSLARALEFLRELGPERLNSTDAVALQTMVFAAADPDGDRLKIAANVRWLEDAQIKPGEGVEWPGTWTISALAKKRRKGDNSTTHYALLGLNAAREVGVPVKPEVWALARRYWEQHQHADGGWAYYVADQGKRATAGMTCAGISSLIITGQQWLPGEESLAGDQIQNCGKGGIGVPLERGVDWITRNFRVGENPPFGQQGRYAYLHTLEEAGRLTGQRFFGKHDWFREAAGILVHEQDKLQGFWLGAGPVEGQEPIGLVTTSLALMVLARGRAPVLINKLRHGPAGDGNTDRDDIRNLVGAVSRDWKSPLNWQVVDPAAATVEDLMGAPIVYFNGHEVPEFNDAARKVIRDYVEQGGFLLAEACCGRKPFDQGFRTLMAELFPGEEQTLHPLARDHAVWRSKHVIDPDIHPLWGIEYGCRTVVIYSPGDLSCFWNQAETSAANPAVIKAMEVGQNIVDYATGREPPADKLTDPVVVDFDQAAPRPGALRIARLRHTGDWNAAPLAVPNLMDSLRRPPLNLDVAIRPKELFALDPDLVNYRLITMHGRAAFAFRPQEIVVLRRHLEAGGTLFADAACGSPAFDAAFRQFVADLLPGRPLVPIPRNDDIFTRRVHFDLANEQFSKAAGGQRGCPQLEGVQHNGRWALIYSAYDIGCALERHQGIDCKGYSHESAVRIATNIVMYTR
jgi:hypothetical protein